MHTTKVLLFPLQYPKTLFWSLHLLSVGKKQS
nr:MAG TPA: hypothetical protein [Caudoviricetes sp.]